jgi:riboflavin kinase/FMN adenylyltransferase
MSLVRLRAPGPLGWPRPAVALGNFDGVHRGHQALVAAVVARARAHGGTPVVLTFDPHPARVLSPDRAPRALMTVEQKAEVLASLGVERVVALPFTLELSQKSPEEFAALVLRDTVGAALVAVGPDFRFGRDREGSLRTLERLGPRLGFDVEAVPAVMHGSVPISSTRIRESLVAGDVVEAKALLGRRHFVDGHVVRGDGRGRALGVPTANLDPVNEQLPAGGVYACWCRLAPAADGVAAVVNIGTRPTFGGGPATAEAHLLDFEADLYGRPLRVEFAARLREERKFPDASALARQIRDDIAAARRVLEKA